jgi:hypothetical protein
MVSADSSSLESAKNVLTFRLRKHPVTTNQTAKNGNRKLVSALEQ